MGGVGSRRYGRVGLKTVFEGSAQDGMGGVGKPMPTLPRFTEAPSAVTLKRVQVRDALNIDRLTNVRWNVGLFLSQFLFSSGEQRCEALVCPFSVMLWCVLTL